MKNHAAPLHKMAAWAKNKINALNDISSYTACLI